MGQIEEEEIARALAYRQRMSNRVAYRANQLRRFAGNSAMYNAVWDKFRKIYDVTNYVEDEPDSGGFATYFDLDPNGDLSGSRAVLPGTKKSRSSTPPQRQNLR